MKLDSVALTGGNGTLGRLLVRHLSQFTHVITADIVPGPASVKSRYADVLSYESIRQALVGQDAVVHLAALSLPADFQDKVFQVNVMGTWNVLRAASDLGIRKVVLLSSVCSSGIINFSQMPLARPDYLPIDETHPLRPLDYYGVSKQVSENIGRSFARQGEMQVIALRPTLIVMPGWEGYLKEGRDKNDDALWSYVMDEDVVRAVRLALELELEGFDAFILSARNTFAPEETLTFMERKFGAPMEVRDPELYVRNPYAAIWDISHAERVLGFAPKGDWRAVLNIENAVEQSD